MLVSKRIIANTYYILKILLEKHSDLYRVLPELLDSPTKYRNHGELLALRPRTVKKAKHI